MGKVNAMHQDQVEAAYEHGAKDAYYGRPRTSYFYDVYMLEAYDEGYNEKPYGDKDYG